MTLLVPYRDREEHLKEFIDGVRPKLLEANVLVVEQLDKKPFNRGKLLNVGYMECDDLYICCHDVDMVPVAVSYKPIDGVTQLAYSSIQRTKYLGGVTMFDYATFVLSGGYHNDFWHRAEDNEMMFNLQRLNIPVINRWGVFRFLPHERTGPEFIPELWQKAQLPRTKDMLKTCEYKLISKEVKDGYTHLKVEL